MSRLTRDGTTEPVSRDHVLRHARGQGNIHFPCSADHEQDWQPYPVDPYSAVCDDHTYIHTYPPPPIHLPPIVSVSFCCDLSCHFPRPFSVCSTRRIRWRSRGPSCPASSVRKSSEASRWTAGSPSTIACTTTRSQGTVCVELYICIHTSFSMYPEDQEGGRGREGGIKAFHSRAASNLPLSRSTLGPGSNVLSTMSNTRHFSVLLKRVAIRHPVKTPRAHCSIINTISAIIARLSTLHYSKNELPYPFFGLRPSVDTVDTVLQQQLRSFFFLNSESSDQAI